MSDQHSDPAQIKTKQKLIQFNIYFKKIQMKYIQTHTHSTTLVGEGCCRYWWLAQDFSWSYGD